MPSNTSILSFREKVAYACGDTASVLYYRSFAMFLMIFYTDVFGLSLAAISWMFLISRFWDAANDPIMGIIADRTKSKHGKFRPWLRWISVPLALSSVLLFTVPDLGPNGKLAWAWITYLVSGILYTAVNIPYGALMGVMSPVSADRTILSSFRFYGAYAADLIVKGSTIWLIARLGGGDEAAGYQYTVALYAIVATALFFFTFSNTKERVQPIPNSDVSVHWARDLKLLTKNRPWLVLCLMGLLTLIWISIRSGATLYYFKYYIGNYDSLTSWFLVTGVAATFAGVFCLAPLTRLFRGKRNTFAALTTIVSATALLFHLVTPDRIPLLFAIEVVASFFSGPLLPLFWSMIADTADYGEWKFERRSTGLVFSAGTFSQKAGWAIGGAVSAALLGAYGFIANAAPSAETVSGIKALMGAIPSTVGFLTAIAAAFYGISYTIERQIERELEVRRRSA